VKSIYPAKNRLVLRTAIETDQRPHLRRRISPSVTVEHDGHAIVLTLSGDVDTLTTPGIRQLLDRTLSRRPGLLIIDLAKVEFLNSTGLTMLLVAHRDHLRLVANQRAALRPLQRAGMHAHFAVDASRHDASPRGKPPGRWLSWRHD
jgi:anti-sigma B factor antagonist